MEKYSKQREEILEFLKNTYSHPTAEEIYQQIKKQNSTASRGTVYRNLGLLTEKGIIIKIPMGNQSDRYDYIRKPHMHIICKKCGKTMDFDYNTEFEKLKKEIYHQTEIMPEEHEIAIQGICKECQNHIKFEEVKRWN